MPITTLPFDPAYDADGQRCRQRDLSGWLRRERENFLHSIQYNYANAQSLNDYHGRKS